MALLTNAQLQGLASPDLDAGTELDPRFHDPYPDAACWGWALCGGPSLHGNAEPATIFGNAINTNTGGYVTGLKPDFVDWVNVAFGANVNANNQARILSENFNPALIELDDDAQDACRTAFAKLCIIVNGLTIPEAPTNYKIVMASDHWYTWEHWALGLKNNIAAPDNPVWQYTQRDAGVNPVNTRCGHVWGAHPLLTEICVSELQDGHLMYLPHAVGWPAPVAPAAPAEPVTKVDQNGLPPETTT
ncbi:MAG: hypothetical protein ABID63_00480 [Pseudomonadota bacterium]